MDDPAAVIRKTLAWIGDTTIDVEKAVAAVEPRNRTQKRAPSSESRGSSSIEPEYAAMFDELYEMIHAGKGLEHGFIRKLNEANHELVPRIQAAQQAVQDDQVARRKRRAEQVAAGQTPAEDLLPAGAMSWEE